MKTVFHKKRISGILTVLTLSVYLFVDDVWKYSFP